MKSNKLIFAILFLFLSVLSIHGTSQSCRDFYNNALGNYNKGQFENVDNDLAGCISDFISNKEDYRESRNGREANAVFKVYKLIITSYKNLDKDDLAEARMNDLITFFANKLNSQAIEARLNNTQLAPM